MKTNKELIVLDVGCRYGIFPLFKNLKKKLNFLMVDVDAVEIERLKKKYDGYNNIKFFQAFLGSTNGPVNINITEHKGYISSKAINKDSFWFSKLRPDEDAVSEVKTIQSVKSSEWIKKEAPSIDILKLDIEGGELDFLIAMEDQIASPTAIVAECFLDRPYQGNSNFSTISEYLFTKGYQLVGAEMENAAINEFHTPQDRIPICMTCIFLNKKINTPKDRQEGLQYLQTLFALKLQGLFFDYLLSHIHTLSKDECVLFEDMKFSIGHVLYKKQREIGHGYDWANNLYKQIFGEPFPRASDFNEHEFFNPA